MGARDYPGATCGRLVVMRMKVDKKKNGIRERPYTAKKPRKKGEK